MRSLALILVSIAVFAVSYALAVSSEVGQRIESLILEAATFSTEPPAPLGLVSLPFIAITLAVIGTVAWIQYGRSRAIIVIVTAGAAILASQLLKSSLVRPYFAVDVLENSFPSGHMTVYVATVMALLAAVPRRFRGVVAVLGTALLAIVSAQLLWYGWHRPSDIIGAIALTSGVFGLSLMIFPSAYQAGGRSLRISRMPVVLRLLGIAGIVALMVGAIAFGIAIMTWTPWLALTSSLIICAALGGVVLWLLYPLLAVESSRVR